MISEQLKTFMLPEHTMKAAIARKITETIGEVIELGLQVRMLDRAKLAGAKMTAEQLNMDGALRSKMSRQKAFVEQLLSIHKAEEQTPTDILSMLV